MSEAFRQYVTSTAFSISLSRSMCDAIEFVMADYLLKGTLHPLANIPNLSSMASLARRGLVAHRQSDHWELTDAGHAIYPLLVMAGLVRSKEEMVAIFKARVA